jgi:hypothetical protein
MTASAPLIVPVEVSAMVVNDPAMNLLRAEMDYTQLANAESPTPAPFQSDEVNFAADPANHGIYLMWTLPAGLRRRHRAADGTTGDFPFAPNRWLAVRLFRPQGAAPSSPPSITSWVVQSDAIDAKDGGAAYVDPTQPTVLTPTRIGTRTEITAASPWVEPANPPAPFLQAVAESNPAFAAFQPFNANVFSLFDDLQTQGVGAGTASYYVVGWYADPAADPLAAWPSAATPATAFADALADLGWTVDLTGGETTTTTVLQGSANAVPWQPGGPQPPSPKDGVSPTVAIGQTSMDAVVAFTRAAFEQAGTPQDLTPDQAAELIEAFEYGLLPMLGKPGAEAMLESQIRSHWFGASDGGCTWTIVSAEQPPGTAPIEPSAAELAAERRWLLALNTAQDQLDETIRELLGLQSTLFALWWKQGAAEVYFEQTGWQNYPWGITSTAEFTPAIDALVDQIRALLATLARLQAQVPTPTAGQTLEQAIAAFAAAKGLPATRLLKQVPGSQFWAPVDPVAVLSNTAHTMQLDPGGTIACRWPQAIVSAIELSPGGGAAAFTVTAAQAASAVPAIPASGLPSIAPSLIAELFLLDPLGVAQLAAAAGQVLDAAQLASAAQSMAPPVVPSDAGTPAALLAPYPWQQPWKPVYFDWSVDWYPIPFQASDGTPNWAFDGLDYDLVPGRTFTPTAQDIQGRTYLTPKPAFEFRAQVERFIRDYPGSPLAAELQQIDGVLEQVDTWDFLSQSLSGLGAQLAGWNPVPTSVPDGAPLPGGGSIAEYVGTQGAAPPLSLMADPQRVLPPSSFEGLRGGQLLIERITVVDAFGQTLEIVEAPTTTNQFPHTVDGAVFHPLIADGLAASEPLSPVEAPRYVQLPPRVLQPTRLNLEFMEDASGTAILGWVLPDHPDSSVAIYGPDGTAYGALRLGVNLAGAPAADWDPAPGSPWPTLPTPSAQLPPLEQFVATLQARGAAALADFLGAVDESLWTVDPLGARSDQFLSLLIGRPLAVVSAAVSLELRTSPWRDLAWPYTFDDPLPPFLDYPFEIRLGDLGYHEDGLIGYFSGGDFGQFNCIHEPDSAASGYLKPIGPGNFVEASFGSVGRGAAQHLTMLIDPRAGVHAQCALVPVVSRTLPAAWVDPALAAMAATFRVGPALVAQQSVVPAQAGGPTTAVVLPRFAESRGTLTWLEADGAGGWIERALVPPTGTAALPPTAPTLREGLLKLTGGVDQ